MRIYFVDYENVNNGGMKGLENLTKKDVVYILYSENANTMQLQTAEKIRNSLATIQFVKIKHLGKNALDFQLCALLGTKIGKFRGRILDLYIVSNDTGYDPMRHGMIEMFENNYRKKGKTLFIKRIPNLAQTQDTEKKIEEKKEGKVQQKTKSDGKEKQIHDMVVAAIANTKYQGNVNTIVSLLMKKQNKDIVQFHNDLVKSFGPKEGKNIYHLLKPTLIKK